MQNITLYHGSPSPNIKKLRDNSYVTIFPHVAYIMGLYYKKSGKTWTDNDIVGSYNFGPNIRFKRGKEPDDTPTIYALKTTWKNVIFHNNFPHEMQIKKGVKTRKLSKKEVDKLVKKSVEFNKCMKLYDELVYYG